VSPRSPRACVPRDGRRSKKCVARTTTQASRSRSSGSNTSGATSGIAADSEVTIMPMCGRARIPRPALTEDGLRQVLSTTPPLWTGRTSTPPPSLMTLFVPAIATAVSKSGASRT
jgi:hypothetical protein